MTTRPRLAVDVGNSCVKVALCDESVRRGSELAFPVATRPPEDLRLPFGARASGGQAGGGQLAGGAAVVADSLPLVRVPLQDPQWCARLCEAVGPWLRASVEGADWHVVSVNSPATEVLHSKIEPQHGWRLLQREDIDLPVELDHPERVGVDRLVGAYGAQRVAGADSVIAIDAGSAVTVDLVRGGTFRGGAILPGMRLQFESLGQGTDRLPRIPAAADLTQGGGEALPMPGRNTEAAMRSGVLLGMAGAVERLVASLREASDEELAVVLTGGDAGVLSRLLRTPHVLVPDLVVRTIAMLTAKI